MAYNQYQEYAYAASQEQLVGRGGGGGGGREAAYAPYQHDEASRMLAQDKYYNMHDLNSAANPSSSSGPRNYADPDAGWAEKRASMGSSKSAPGFPEPKSGKKKAVILTAIILGIIIVAAVVVGVVVTQLKKKNSDSSSSSSGSKTKISADPSNFSKDSRLHQSFYGMCYTPLDSQYQFGCGADLGSVIEDVQLLSQLTTRIRLYGADCNVTALVLQAIQDTKTNLTVFPAIYLNGDDPGDAAWTRQLDNITFALDNYGLDHVGGVTVGNEYLLNGGSETSLLNYVQKFRDHAKQKNWDVLVGSADAGSMFTANVASGVDYFMANVHAFFAGTLVADGPGWTYNYFEETDNSIAKAASNAPKAYIAETGWPSGANETSQLTYVNDNGQATGAVAGLDNLQTFLDGYVCEANKNGTGYFWFEMYDEEWKEAMYGGVEAYWGLFDKNKKLKNLNIPACSHD